VWQVALFVCDVVVGVVVVVAEVEVVVNVKVAALVPALCVLHESGSFKVLTPQFCSFYS